MVFFIAAWANTSVKDELSFLLNRLDKCLIPFNYHHLLLLFLQQGLGIIITANGNKMCFFPLQSLSLSFSHLYLWLITKWNTYSIYTVNYRHGFYATLYAQVCPYWPMEAPASRLLNPLDMLSLDSGSTFAFWYKKIFQSQLVFSLF